MLRAPFIELNDASALTSVRRRGLILVFDNLPPTPIIQLIHHPKYSLSPAIDTVLSFADLTIIVDIHTQSLSLIIW